MRAEVILTEIWNRAKLGLRGLDSVAQEREIKLRVEDVGALEQALAQIGAKRVHAGSGRVHEWNTIFDTKQQRLAKNGQLLRIRRETPDGTDEKKRIILTFKRPPASVDDDGHGHKVREEIETQVSDEDALQRILEGLGVSAWFIYEKFRTTMKLPSSDAWAAELMIELDETPIGTFLELEGPAEAIDRAATELCYAKQDYIANSYLGLYIEDCKRRGETPGNMLFEKVR